LALRVSYKEAAFGEFSELESICVMWIYTEFSELESICVMWIYTNYIKLRVL